jgi:hypothetical protein
MPLRVIVWAVFPLTNHSCVRTVPPAWQPSACHSFSRTISPREGPQEAAACLCSTKREVCVLPSLLGFSPALRHADARMLAVCYGPAPLLYNEAKLVIVGGARGEDDLERVRELKTLAIDLGVEVRGSGSKHSWLPALLHSESSLGS